MESFSLLSYFFQASFVVKLVMIILFLLSIISWTIIFQQSKILTKISNDIKLFKITFLSSSDLSTLYSNIQNRYRKDMNLLNLFIVGFKEYMYGFKQMNRFSRNELSIVDNIKRAMQTEHCHEMAMIEGKVGLLATIGSTSPYIGLFGTVWGIMTSFHALRGVEHATISLVAPGISEALIATALGLFAAIPAVIAYNRFVEKITRIENQYHSLHL